MNSNGVSARFQGISVAVTVGIICLLMVRQLNKFCSIDQEPALHRLTPRALTKFTTTPARVHTGLTVTDFSEFDVEGNKFKMNGIIWFFFDPSLISLETIGQFSFLRGEIEYKSEPITQLISGKVLVRYTIRVLFRTNLYYGFFPFEDHTVYISLANMNVTPGELIFESSAGDLTIESDVYISSWRYHDHRVEAGYGEINVGAGTLRREIDFPQVVFAIDFFHHSMRYIISIILPLLVIFLIDIFSFCFDQKENRGTLVSLSTANIIALTAYRFVLDNLSPKVGYALLADYVFFLFLFTTFITFVMNSVGPILTVFQRKIISISLQVLVVGVFIFLLAVWIPC